MDNLWPNRRWLILPTSVTSSIDWNQVLETNENSLRLSIDGSKTFVKYDIYEVTASYTQTYNNLSTGESGSVTIEAGIYGRPSIYTSSFQEYTHPEILEELSTEEWTRPITGSMMP